MRGKEGLGDRASRPRHRSGGGAGTGVGGLDLKERNCAADRLRSGSGQPGGPRENVWDSGVPEALPPAPGPGPRTAGRAVLRLGPPGRHPTVTGSPSTPSVRPSILQGHPPPPVRRGSPRSRPWGSIGRLATRGRGSRACAPSPARATQDTASEQRPRRFGPRPGPAPRQPGRRRRTGPFRSRPPRHAGVGRGTEREPSLPGPQRPAPHPTPAPPRRAECPRGRALHPRRAARPGGGARGAGGRAGWGYAAAKDHFGVRRAILIPFPALPQPLSFGKRKERNPPCVWAPLGSGVRRGHPRAKHGGRTWRGDLAGRGGPRGDLGQTNPR